MTLCARHQQGEDVLEDFTRLQVRHCFPVRHRQREAVGTVRSKRDVVKQLPVCFSFEAGEHHVKTVHIPY